MHPKSMRAQNASHPMTAHAPSIVDAHDRLARRIRALRHARYVSGVYLVGVSRSGHALALSLAPLTAATLLAIVDEARVAGLSLPVDIYAPPTVRDGLTWRVFPLPRRA